MKLSDFLAKRLKLPSPEDTVHAAGEQMREAGTSNMPVVSGLQLVGMLKHPDPDLNAARYGHDPRRVMVGDVMHADSPCCRDDEDVASALQMLEREGLDCLPVVDDQYRVIAVLHRSDLEADTAGAENSAE